VTILESESPKKKSRRGFASMTPEQRRAIASKGGKASQATGRAHQYTTEEAKVAGAKGGLAKKKPSVVQADETTKLSVMETEVPVEEQPATPKKAGRKPKRGK
jgi:general stress protein YciG